MRPGFAVLLERIRGNGVRTPAKWLHRQGWRYRAIGAELAKTDHINERGRPFHQKSVRAMLDG